MKILQPAYARVLSLEPARSIDVRSDITQELAAALVEPSEKAGLEAAGLGKSDE